jgi:ubiquinol-cytochrome c reductase iron-sulfur subunit
MNASADDADPDLERRRFLTGVTTGVGVVGVGFGATPFVLSMTPSERAKAAGAPVEVDVSQIPPGEMKIVEWRGKPVWLLRRTPEMLAGLKAVEGQLADPKSERSLQPSYVSPQHRATRPELLVMVGICTHLGCSPVAKLQAGAGSDMGGDWPGGFFCPCHGSKFDLAGRVYKNVPAPTNMEIPPYTYLAESRVLIGIHPEGKGGPGDERVA